MLELGVSSSEDLAMPQPRPTEPHTTSPSSAEVHFLRSRAFYL